MSEKYFSIMIKEIGLDESQTGCRWVRGVLEMLVFIDCSLERVSIRSFKDLVEPLGDKEDLCLFSFISKTVFRSFLLADCSIIIWYWI